MSEQTLFAAVYAEPEADAPRRVLADFLQARGDPRGEFIALQLLEAPDAAQRERMEELLRSHGERWCAQLSPLLEEPSFTRGFVSRAEVRGDALIELLPAMRAGLSPAWQTLEALALVNEGAEIELELALRSISRLSSLRELELDTWTHVHRSHWCRRTQGLLEWQRLHVRRLGPALVLGFGTRAPGRLELELELERLSDLELAGLGHDLRPLELELVRVIAAPDRFRSVSLARLRSTVAQLQLQSLRWLELPLAAFPRLEPLASDQAWGRVPLYRDCACSRPGEARFDNFERTRLGTDTSAGRYGEVSLWRCQRCAQLWIHYLLEYEGFSGSGRYFRGPIDDARADEVTPHNAIELLELLPEFLRGGSYFGTASWSEPPLALGPGC